MPRYPVLAAFALASLGLLGIAASADVVKTKDGLVLEGKVVRAADGGITVTTDAGEVRLPASAVVGVTEGEGPRAAALREAQALGKDDAQGHFRLALVLEAKGLFDVARDEYRAVLGADPDHLAARRALGFERVGAEWLTVTEARRRHGLVFYDGRWLLPQEVDLAAKPGRRASPKDVTVVSAMRTAALADAPLARAALERLDRARARERIESATALLLDRDAKVRRWACGELAAQGDETALRPLIASAVRDGDAEVRKAAVKAAATFGHDDVAIPLVLAMWSEHPGIVANAAKALGMLGDGRAIRYLVKRIDGHGSSPRAYFAQENQQSYIRDFDVEVAQTSSIADPQIGVIQEGVVQDAKVLDAMIQQTIVEQTLIDTFNGLAGTSLKTPDQVAAWYHEHGAALPDFPPKPAPRRGAPAGK